MITVTVRVRDTVYFRIRRGEWLAVSARLRQRMMEPTGSPQAMAARASGVIEQDERS